MYKLNFYEIRIAGHFTLSWTDWFEGLAIRDEPTGETTSDGLPLECGAPVLLAAQRRRGAMMDRTLFKSWWKAFLHPRTPMFREALGHKSNLRTWVGVAAGALLGVGLSWLTHLLSGQSPQDFMGIASIWVAPGTPPPFSSWVVISLLGVILGFLNFEIVLFIFARLLGGKGSFGAQAYAQSLFYAPLAIIQQVFAATPYIGRLLFFLFAAYSLLPTTTSLRAAHGYSTWRAVLTWLMPILLNVVVVYVVVMLLISITAH